MKVRFKKLYPDAKIPTKAHPTDAGFDLYALRRTVDEDDNYSYGTGIAVEIPEGYAGLVFPRSSISKMSMALTNSVGLIDSGYRGEIKAKFRTVWNGKRDGLKVYDYGDRIAQLVIIPYPEIELVEADELSETDRGTGGYGSTGR